MFDEIIEKLKGYPGAEVRIGEDYIRVLPATSEGFEVKIDQIWENHFSVTLDGWHEEFFNYQDASACFFMGLSNQCRVKIEEKGGSRFKWTLEYLDGENWRERSSTQRLVHQFWKPSVTTYLQNNLLRESRQERLVEVHESLTHQ